MKQPDPITDILNRESSRMSKQVYDQALKPSPWYTMLQCSGAPANPLSRLEKLRNSLRTALYRIRDAYAVLTGTKEARDIDDDWD